MDTPAVHEEGSEPDTTQAVATVRCDGCGSAVAATATDTVPVKYMSTVIDETWCTLCIRAKDEATKRALQIDTNDTPDY